MANHKKERYFQLNSSTHRQDENYLVLDKKNKPEPDIQAQVHNKREMGHEHIMEKELILNDKEHDKIEYNNFLTIFEVEPLLQLQSQALQPLQNLFQILKSWIEFIKNR